MSTNETNHGGPDDPRTWDWNGYQQKIAAKKKGKK